MEDAVKRKDATELVVAMKAALMAGTASEEVSIVFDERGALEATKALLQAAVAAVQAQMTDLNKSNVNTQLNSSGTAILEMTNVQCFEPRGRFDLKVTDSHIVLQGKQFSVLVPTKAVVEVICLPSCTSAKKEGEDYLAIKLREPVKINNKDSNQLLLNLMRVANPSTVSRDGDLGLNESTAVVLALQDATGCHVQRPQQSLFATCREQKPYLKCYRGTQEGAIYPLQCGVVFIKPLLIISADEIASLSAGRGGGSGNTRYVDLLIETAGDKTHEFTNIDRDELPALQMYVKGYLEARAARQQKQQQQRKVGGVIDITSDEVVEGDHAVEGDVADESEAEGEEGRAGRDLYDTDSSDEDDEDYDPDASDSDRGRRKRRGKKQDRGSDAGSGSERSEGSDSDDSGSDSGSGSEDDSDDSGSDGEEGGAARSEEECSGDEEVRGAVAATKVKATKTKPGAKAEVASPSPAKARKAAPVKAVSVKAEPVASSKDRPRPVPGQPIRRVLPGIPPVTATTGGLIKSEPGTAPMAAKEGRKSAPVKRTHTGPGPKPVVVKSESVVVLDEATTEVAAVVKQEPAAAPVIDLRASSASEVPPPTVRVKSEPGAAATVDLTATATAATSTTSTTTASTAGVKRTILDMFAPIKKKSLPEAVDGAVGAVVDLADK